jgi:hypothetical protein
VEVHAQERRQPDHAFVAHGLRPNLLLFLDDEDDAEHARRGEVDVRHRPVLPGNLVAVRQGDHLSRRQERTRRPFRQQIEQPIPGAVGHE